MQTRLFLVDDHQIMIEGLRMLLGRHESMQIVGTAGDGVAAWSALCETRPEVVLMDLELPGIDGITLTQQVREQLPGTRVIILTGQMDAKQAGSALAAGAQGYVLKSEAYLELVDAINAVMAGRHYVSPAVAQLLADDVRRKFNTQNGPAALTERERDIVRRIADGQSTKEIADALGISARTVETHRSNLMAKTGVQGVAELTKFALRTGLTKL